VFGAAADALFGLGKATPDACTTHVHLNTRSRPSIFPEARGADCGKTRLRCSKCGLRDVAAFAISFDTRFMRGLFS
jgi:hypothetical protein